MQGGLSLIDEWLHDRMLATMNRTSPAARRVLAAYAVGIGPAALLAVLLFGGQVRTLCLGGPVGNGLGGFQCPPPTDGPIPIIGTAAGFRVAVVVLAVAWLLALLALSWSAIRGRRGRILGLLAPAGACAVALGVAAALWLLASGVRLRTVALTGITVAVLVAAVVWIVTVTHAAWRSDR